MCYTTVHLQARTTTTCTSRGAPASHPGAEAVYAQHSEEEDDYHNHLTDIGCLSTLLCISVLGLEYWLLLTQHTAVNKQLCAVVLFSNCLLHASLHLPTCTRLTPHYELARYYKLCLPYVARASQCICLVAVERHLQL